MCLTNFELTKLEVGTCFRITRGTTFVMHKKKSFAQERSWTASWTDCITTNWTEEQSRYCFHFLSCWGLKIESDLIFHISFETYICVRPSASVAYSHFLSCVPSCKIHFSFGIQLPIITRRLSSRGLHYSIAEWDINLFIVLAYCTSQISEALPSIEISNLSYVFSTARLL